MTQEIIVDILRLIVLAGLGGAGILSVVIWKKNRATKATFLRYVIQAVSLASLYYLFTIKPAIPFLYVLITWFAVTLFLGRFFCGWICPFAFIMDIESVIRKTLKIRPLLLPDKFNTALHKSRYIILSILLLLPIILILQNPPPNTAATVMMAKLLAGPFRPYSIIMDPLIPFIVPWTGQLVIGNINFSYPYIGNIITFTGITVGQVFAAVFVIATLAGAFLIRRFWCRFCPAGASIATINQLKVFKKVPLLYIEKNEEKCTKCGICKRVCHVQVNKVYEQKNGKIGTSQCMLCTRCVEMCPYEDTLKVKLGNKTVFKSRNWIEPTNNKQQKEV
jgi:polyferredoxin